MGNRVVGEQVQCSAACFAGDCGCSEYDGMLVVPGDDVRLPPYHDGCTCVTRAWVEGLGGRMNLHEFAQELVGDAVRKRGYREGWTAGVFAARQVVKLQEELGELSAVVLYPNTAWGEATRELTLMAGAMARKLFSESTGWKIAFIADTEQVKAEAADMLVVLFCLAEAMSEFTGERFDLVRAAVEKAQRDVERGVR